MVGATRQGYEFATRTPGRALDDLLGGASGLDREEQRAELNALERANAFAHDGSFRGAWLRTWPKWEAAHRIVSDPPKVNQLFDLNIRSGSPPT